MIFFLYFICFIIIIIMIIIIYKTEIFDFLLTF